MIRTFETRIPTADDRHADLLGEIAAKMCVAERKIHSFLAVGKEWKADEYRHIYTKLGLSSLMFRSAKDSLGRQTALDFGTGKGPSGRP